MILHGYYRSSAAWRVRIALGLKGIPVDQAFHHLRKGEQHDPAYLRLNPQGLLPTLELDDGTVLTQSLAICEYLDETWPEPPLLPGAAAMRARIRAAVLVVAADIHPVQNLRVLKRLRTMGHDEAAVQGWARTVIDEGLSALDRLVAEQTGRFSFGDAPTLADVFLIPQMGNARRFGVELRWPRLLDIEAACQEMEAFRAAAPDQQADAE